MLYDDKSMDYVGEGISKVKNNFMFMCSFTTAINEIYANPGLVATCNWLADRQGYINSDGMLVDFVPTLFKQYGREDIITSVLRVDQRIFDLTTNWVIYPSLESMVKELEWNKEN